MSRGRPKYTPEQRQAAREKQKADRVCLKCGATVSRATYYKHRKHGCGIWDRTQPDNDAVEEGTELTTGKRKRPHAEVPVPSTSDKRAHREVSSERSTTDGNDDREQSYSAVPLVMPSVLAESEGVSPSRPDDDAHQSSAQDQDLFPQHVEPVPGRSEQDLDNSNVEDDNLIDMAGPVIDMSGPPADPGSLDDDSSDEDENNDRISGTSEDEGGDDEHVSDSHDHNAADRSQTPPAGVIPPSPEIFLDELKLTQRFITALEKASIATSGLPTEIQDRLRNPPTEELLVEDPVTRFSLEVYLHDASESVYNGVRSSLARIHNLPMLSYAEVKNKVQTISGVHPMYHDMCIGGCIAYTGPFAKLARCPKCGEHRYDQHALKTKKEKRARQQFVTNPIGPQIQVAYRSRQSAEEMSYRARCTRNILEAFNNAGSQMSEWSDYLHGTEYIEAVMSKDLTDDSTVLMLSLDGAQLYRNKTSDCWMYIWVLMDRSPELRYKKQHVVVGGIIPGPNKPGNVDSFLFPGFYHLSALMREGLVVWDASKDRIFTTYPFLAFLTADGPGMTEINGLVGHSGARGCRLYCDMKGRHKPDVGHYYPACLKPHDFAVDGCSHDDVDLAKVTSRESQLTSVDRYEDNLLRVLVSRTPAQYRQSRLETGISKPALVSGLPSQCMYPLPGCCPADLMHLAFINDPDLLINAWRGSLVCDTRMGDSKDTWDWAVLKSPAVWNAHGKQVAAATPYLPGSFDRPPRNPAEKISSGYKAVEFQMYLYGLGPALFYGLLPKKYWRNYCKLVRSIRIVSQRRITRAELAEAHKSLLEFCTEWEELYYQRKASRLHFVRQSIHALAHICPETMRIGPYACVTQWTMERVIGDLGSEIRQHSNPYANLSRRAVRRCQINAVTDMLPELVTKTKPPRASQALTHGYSLLAKHDKTARDVTKAESKAIDTFVERAGILVDADWQKNPKIARWGRLQLPNGQVARCLWMEAGTSLRKLRMARNVKLSMNNITQFGEVRYYFALDGVEHCENRAFAMVDLYGPRDDMLYEESSRTLWSCRRQDNDEGLTVVDVTQILSVVAMVPHPLMSDASLGDFSGRVYVVEKIGLDVMVMAGMPVEEIQDEPEREE